MKAKQGRISVDITYGCTSEIWINFILLPENLSCFICLLLDNWIHLKKEFKNISSFSRRNSKTMNMMMSVSFGDNINVLSPKLTLGQLPKVSGSDCKWLFIMAILPVPFSHFPTNGVGSSEPCLLNEGYFSLRRIHHASDIWGE